MELNFILYGLSAAAILLSGFIFYCQTKRQKAYRKIRRDEAAAILDMARLEGEILSYSAAPAIKRAESLMTNDWVKQVYKEELLQTTLKKLALQFPELDISRRYMPNRGVHGELALLIVFLKKRPWDHASIEALFYRIDAGLFGQRHRLTKEAGTAA